MTGLLSTIIFAPWIGALLLACLPRVGPKVTRVLALLFSLSTLVLGLVAWAGFHPGSVGFQFVEQHEWIPALNIYFHLGLDGLSLILVLLTGLVAPAAMLASWKNEHDPRLYNLLFLFLQGAALGVFLALNFFPWFIFWELSLVPAFFLIKLWGGPDTVAAGRAAYQFVVYTIGGSAFLLLGFAALFSATRTFDFVSLAAAAHSGSLAAKVSGPVLTMIFLGVLLGLAVKVPLFPFHTWLPSAYAEAPTGASMFLTGIMSKMGVYGFLRILWPIFPAQLQAAAPVLIGLALAGVVLGAFAAMAQTDLKRMVAYSSINHVSYCLLALFTVAFASGSTGALASVVSAKEAALSGALLQMFNHGLSASALFFCVALLEARAGGKRGLNDFGGVRTAAPVFAGFCGIAMFSSLGLPGLNGFVGEFLVFRGVFGLVPWAAAVGCLGLFATAYFLLTFWQRVFHGPEGPGVAKFPDLSPLEIVTLAPGLALMFVLGVWPQLLIGVFNPLVESWVYLRP